MNKRENAIWKIVAFLGLLILALNIFSAIKSNERLTSSIYGRKCDSLDKNCKEKSGIIDYFYEFEEYPDSIIESDINMVNIINSYNIDSEEILNKSKKKGQNEQVEISKLEFMEIYSPSSIYGFSLKNKKISSGDEVYLTEIKVNKEKSFNEICPNKKKVRLNNAIFINDEVKIGQEFTFNSSNLNCTSKNSDTSEDFLFMSEDGEVWYNSSKSIYSFEFNINSGNISDLLEGIDPNIFDNFIILNTKKNVIGISKTNSAIPNGCGMLLKLSIDGEDASLDNIIISDRSRFYDLNILKKYNGYNDSIKNYINYYHSKLNNENNVEVYLKTQDEIDEYYFDILCFECEMKDNVKVRSELEILRAKTKERNFSFSINSNDPLDLSNVVLFEGQDGYNQGKRQRGIIPTAYNKFKDGDEGLVEYQDSTFTVKINSPVGNYRIIDMNQDYFLGKNLENNTIDTLKFKNAK